MELIVILFLFIIVFSVFVGEAMREDNPFFAAILLAGISLIGWGEYICIGEHFSPITNASKLSGNYVVKERFTSIKKGNVAILYSDKESRERIAELKDWPPTGYTETQIGAEQMIIPTPKK